MQPYKNNKKQVIPEDANENQDNEEEKKEFGRKVQEGAIIRSNRASEKPKPIDQVQANIAKLLHKKKQMEDTGGDYVDEEDTKYNHGIKGKKLIHPPQEIIASETLNIQNQSRQGQCNATYFNKNEDYSRQGTNEVGQDFGSVQIASQLPQLVPKKDSVQQLNMQHNKEKQLVEVIVFIN